ncbi:major intrinsic protein, Aquaporin-like protein [Artemisia annua]|uniref:Major intrinsic protein, Aquaporin-like protein n=1 Tax=Artemisia annua TaxID=35608 RepID=A0A2U1MNN1_ARTAN|nr:major intrinsic protein, Aquaporin-like protein [Artemisia annua]
MKNPTIHGLPADALIKDMSLDNRMFVANSFIYNKCWNEDVNIRIWLSISLGAVADVLALTKLMPSEYKHMLEGPTLKVDLHTGAIAEGVLTFLITFVVVIIIIKGPKSFFMKNWMLSVATMAVIILGSSYTGPSMNPANYYNELFIDLFNYFSLFLRWLVFPPPPSPKKKTA